MKKLLMFPILLIGQLCFGSQPKVIKKPADTRFTVSGAAPVNPDTLTLTQLRQFEAVMAADDFEEEDACYMETEETIEAYVLRKDHVAEKECSSEGDCSDGIVPVEESAQPVKLAANMPALKIHKGGSQSGSPAPLPRSPRLMVSASNVPDSQGSDGSKSPGWRRGSPRVEDTDTGSSSPHSYEQLSDVGGDPAKSPRGRQRFATFGAKDRTAELLQALRARAEGSDSCVEPVQSGETRSSLPEVFLSQGRARGLKVAKVLGVNSEGSDPQLRKSDPGKSPKIATSFKPRNSEAEEAHAERKSSRSPRSPRSKKVSTGEELREKYNLTIFQLKQKKKEYDLDEFENTRLAKKNRVLKEKAEKEFKVELFEVGEDLKKHPDKVVDYTMLTGLIEKADKSCHDCLTILYDWFQGYVENGKISDIVLDDMMNDALMDQSGSKARSFVQRRYENRKKIIAEKGEFSAVKIECLKGLGLGDTEVDNLFYTPKPSLPVASKKTARNNLQQIKTEDGVSTVTAAEIWQREEDEAFPAPQLRKQGVGAKIKGKKRKSPRGNTAIGKPSGLEISTESSIERGDLDKPLGREYCHLCRELLKRKGKGGSEKNIVLSTRCTHLVHHDCASALELKGGELCRVLECHKAIIPGRDYRSLKEQQAKQEQNSSDEPVGNLNERESSLESQDEEPFAASHVGEGTVYGGVANSELSQSDDDDRYRDYRPQADVLPWDQGADSIRAEEVSYEAPIGLLVDGFEGDDDYASSQTSFNPHDLIEELEAPLVSNLGPLAMGDEAAILRDQDVQPEELVGLAEGGELVFDSAEEEIPQDTRVVVEKRRPRLRPPARPLPAPSPTTFVATDLDDEDTVEL